MNGKNSEMKTLSCYNDKKILLVEGNEINRETATELLRKAGLSIDTAENCNSSNKFSEQAIIKKEEKSLLTQLTSIEGLNYKLGLSNILGNIIKYIHLLKVFGEVYQNEARQIELLLMSQQFDEAIAKIHKMKGAAGTLSLNNIYQLGKTMEVKLRTNPRSNCSTLLNTLSSDLKQFHQQISNIHISETKKKIDIAADIVQKRLKKLTNMLAYGDPMANNYFNKHQSEFKKIYGDIIDLLAKKITCFEYPDALKIIHNIDSKNIT